MLYDVLTKYELIFGGSLGTWKTKPVNIELPLGAKRYHSDPYLLTQAHGAFFLRE